MKKRYYIAWLLWGCALALHADEVSLQPDSVAFSFIAETEELLDSIATSQDSVAFVFMADTVLSAPPVPVKSKFQPDPDMAVWLAAVVPGLGQIYNRQYWKLPIVYGGAMGLAYAISWNNQMFIDYRKAYVDLVDSNPNSTFYEHVLPKGVTIDNSNKDYYTRLIKNKQDGYQRNRDLSIICTAVLYLLTMIDAYVDAQMHDYDISPDLSVQVAPAIMPPNEQQQTDAAVGLRCKFSF